MEDLQWSGGQGEQFWKHAPSIWPCRRLGFMFEPEGRCGKQIQIHMPARFAVEVGHP